MREIISAILSSPSLRGLPERLDMAETPMLISGLGPVHRALLSAAIHLNMKRPLFVVCRDESAAEGYARDLSLMLGSPARLLVSREFAFHTAQGMSRQGEHERIAALDCLLEGRTPATVCTAAALLQRCIPPKVLSSSAFSLSAGQSTPPAQIEEALIKLGYSKTAQVEGRGQFSRRGGILDFFSPAHESPVRCEFWGDEIDTLGFFDTESQRRTEPADACRVLPVSEFYPSLYPGGCEALLEELSRLAREISRKNVKNDAVKEKLREIIEQDAEILGATGSLAAADKYAPLMWKSFCSAADYIPENAIVVLSEPEKTAEAGREFLKALSEEIKALVSGGVLHASPGDFVKSWERAQQELSRLSVVMQDQFTAGKYQLPPRCVFGMTAKQLSTYGGSAETAAGDVSHYISRGFSVTVLAGDGRKAGILRQMLEQRGIAAALQDGELPPPGSCAVSVGSVSSGFEFPEIKLAVLTDTQIVAGGFRRGRRKKALSNKQRLGSYADLSAGDLVVHEYHGIGRFAGIIKMRVEGVEKDYVKIGYAGGDSLYVPATQLDLVSKYIGAGEDAPVKLSKMGGAEWGRVKSRAKGAAKQLARGLVELYAARQRTKGLAFPPDTVWQTEFEDRFGFEETEDQLRCVAEIKADMEKPVPMERLLCGDVGYGKTEVALRAAMKCVLGGAQAAILVPTTVLAHQHFQTASERFFGHPVNIEVLSRFRSPSQIKKALEELERGGIDLVIGTHRLLQKDVKFKKLGLLIVDEEQRFGVSHKERLKEMSVGVDVLTLSATPIPRTLNMALSGLRDMSTIEEPPQDRLPVQTFVIEHDWGTVCDAISREIHRGGQVYYLHNRVENIERTARRISDMLEGVSVAVGHGQMDEESLSSVMEKMVSGECQVLVCTTIIETGIDIPNVNTLIIEDADKLGLAQLHQIRGRVGRSSRRASAYLTFRKSKVLSEVAEKRLAAIMEFAEFNSGFKIAMRDLEIRGAGNLLGAEQSGHMITVGYDMYLKLLEEAVTEERGEAPPVRAECSEDLAVSANIPESYVSSPEQRMDLYRRIALIRSQEEADDLIDEMIDRFGDPPAEVNSLVHVALLRGEASRAGIRDVSQKEGRLMFTLTDFDMERISKLYAQEKYKGRVKVEAGQKPRLGLKLQGSRRVIEQARDFVRAYAEAAGE